MKRAFNGLMAPLALCALGTGAAMAGSPAGEKICEIRTLASSGQLTLEAVARSKHAVTGEYELETKKSGGGGTSSSVQSGDFQVGAGAEIVLSEVEIGGGGSVQARLTLWSAAGDVICTAEFPDKP